MSTNRLRLQKVKGKKAYRFFTHSNDEVCIGDPTETIQFKPQCLLKRWLGECYIKLPIGTTAKQLKFDEENNYIVWEGDWFTVKVYPVDKKERKVRIGNKEHVFIQNELGGLEFEAILKEKPPTNSFNFRIETKGLKFYYQPPLTEELNSDEYDEVTETYAVKDGVVVVFRPPEVVGSYAVYHATKGNMHRNKADAEKYRTGKAFHIYRPKATDSAGNTTWCDLHVDEAKGLLTVTIPQEFLEKAVYPVTIDPTFGYETIGASEVTGGPDTIYGSWYTCPEQGTADSISIYCHRDAADPIKCALYKKSDNSLVAGTEEINASTTHQWNTLNFPTPKPSLENVDYWLCIWGKYIPTSSNCLFLRYDTDTEDDKMGIQPSVTYNSWPDPWNPAVFYAYKMSIYCTYTAEAGAIEVTVTDSVSLSDSALRHKTLTINDSIGASDQALGHKTFTITDVINAIDSMLRDKTLGIADAIQLLDQILRNKSLIISDQMSVSDQILRNKIFDLTDSINLSDFVLSDKILKVPDLIQLVEQILRNKPVTISDLISLSEQLFRDKSFSITDLINASDSIFTHKVFSVTDTMQLLDEILCDKSFVIPDTILLSDLINVIKQIFKTVTDSIELTDQAIIDKNLTISDLIQISAEQVLRDKSLTVTDSISISDAITVLKGILKTVIDNIGLSDEILTYKMLTIPDVIQLTGQIIRGKSFAVSDGISLSDLVNVIKTILKIVSDNISLSDSVLRHKKVFAILDSISLLEEILRHKNFLIQDSVTLSEAVLRNKIFKVQDQISLLESVIASKLFIIADQIGLTDTVQIIQIVKVVRDALKLSEQILAHKELVVKDQIQLLDVITLISLIAKILKLILTEFLPVKIATQEFKPVAISTEEVIE